MEAETKQIETETKQIETETKQIETETKQIETETKQIETETKQIETETNKEAPVEQKTEQPPKITLPAPQKDPKKVEAGRLSAISRAAKRRQREQLCTDDEHEPHPYWNSSSLLYFAVPSVFLMGMYQWSTRRKEKSIVVEYKPKQEERLPEAKKKQTISLFD